MTPLERLQAKHKIYQEKYNLLVAMSERTMEQSDSMLELLDEIERLDKAIEKQSKKGQHSKADEEAAEAAAKGVIQSMIENDRIHFTAVSGLWWWYSNGEWFSAKPPAFFEKYKGYIGASADTYKLFQSLMDQQGRKINAPCYSWTDRPGYLNLLSITGFCQPVEAESYHAVFDLLFNSLGGGKAENVEHLEKVILAKWQHPENFMLPCIVFADKGGTGKSLLVAGFLTPAFGAANVADNLSIEMAFGKFNKSIAGKAVVFANEAPEDREDDKGILRVIHSPTVNIEAKGRDPITSVNTALFLIATNPKSAGYAIKLAYSDVDRRFSILHGGAPLKQYVSKHYNLSIDDNYEAGNKLMMEELQYILRDPQEIGKWLHCKRQQYGDVKHVRALHGQDYQKQADDTVEMHTRVCDAVFLDEDFKYVRSDLLFRLYKDNGGSFKSIGFFRLAKAYLEERQKLGITYEVGYPWNDETNYSSSKRKQARVYMKNAPSEGMTRHALKCNDSTYGYEDNGRWTWFVDVI